MATVRIKLRNSSVPGRAGSVYYQITHRQKSVQITTGYKLLPAEWDGVRQCVAPVLLTGGDYYLRKVQRAIDSDLSVLKNAIGALERAAGHYTAHDVAQAFRESHSGETFFGFMERQIEQLLAHGRLGTARNYRRTRQSFSQFLHGEDLSFAGCTAELVADYEQWLKRRGVTRNTVSFYMRILRKSDVRDQTAQYIRRKTGQSLCIRLEPCITEIIRRYARKTKNSPYVFPIIAATDENEAYAQYQNALSYYNKLLKKLSKLLQADTPLSSYTARHTWATTARNCDIPLSVISAGLGHRSQATTQIYLASLEDSVIDEANRKIIFSLNRPGKTSSL